jgi:hypothetical protein
MPWTSCYDVTWMHLIQDRAPATAALMFVYVIMAQGAAHPSPLVPPAVVLLPGMRCLDMTRRLFLG